MIQNPLGAATDGYLCPGPFLPLSIATSGYLCLVVIVEVVPVSVPGGGKPYPPKTPLWQLKRLHREDDEVLTILMVATIYEYLE